MPHKDFLFLASRLFVSHILQFPIFFFLIYNGNDVQMEKDDAEARDGVLWRDSRGGEAHEPQGVKERLHTHA